MVDPVAPSQSQPAARPVVVRLAIESDRMAIFKLAVFMHQETDFANYQFNPEKAVNYIGAWIHGAPDHYLIVAERAGQVIGMLFLSVKAPWFSDDLMASEDVFYVHPDHRGSRAAYLMMREFCRLAHSGGARHLRAGVATGSGPAAERLYQHFGMHYVGGNFSAHID